MPGIEQYVPASALQGRVCPSDPSTVAVMTLREELEQKEVAESPVNHTSGSPGIEEEKKFCPKCPH